MPILNEGALTKTRYDAVAPLAEALRDTLITERQEQEARHAETQAALRDKAESFYYGMLSEVPDAKFLPIVDEARIRTLKEIDDLFAEGGAPDQKAAQIVDGMSADLGWVVPRPVDAEKVAEIVARDKAQETVEKQIVVRK
jgi:hypothetical protein